ncbi:hypothetical protein [Chryseobacterium indoltheticum]|uniref:hypothetical protein n=1 Tax=Chryseobacterium indoltheticum TaxID=254 RepID=UPI003F49450B
MVKELIQNELNTKNLVKELNFIINGEKRDEMLQDFKLLREKLVEKVQAKMQLILF